LQISIGDWTSFLNTAKQCLNAERSEAIERHIVPLESYNTACSEVPIPQSNQSPVKYAALISRGSLLSFDFQLLTVDCRLFFTGQANKSILSASQRPQREATQNFQLRLITLNSQLSTRSLFLPAAYTPSRHQYTRFVGHPPFCFQWYIPNRDRG